MVIYIVGCCHCNGLSLYISECFKEIGWILPVSLGIGLASGCNVSIEHVQVTKTLYSM